MLYLRLSMPFQNVPGLCQPFYKKKNPKISPNRCAGLGLLSPSPSPSPSLSLSLIMFMALLLSQFEVISGKRWQNRENIKDWILIMVLRDASASSVKVQIGFRLVGLELHFGGLDLSRRWFTSCNFSQVHVGEIDVHNLTSMDLIGVCGGSPRATPLKSNPK